jgi:hypothetical protein
LSGYVGAQHEFHDAGFVQGWANRFVPTPPRVALFDLILKHISTTSVPNTHVVELGPGPGYMPRVKLTKADLINHEWPLLLSQQPGAIISTRTLHDLGGQDAIADVYGRCHALLPANGILMNGDFIKPVGTAWRFEPGHFEIERHLELLRQTSFTCPTSLAHFAHNIDNPTAAQNYACLIAVS